MRVSLGTYLFTDKDFEGTAVYWRLKNMIRKAILRNKAEKLYKLLKRYLQDCEDPAQEQVNLVQVMKILTKKTNMTRLLEWALNSPTIITLC